MRRSTRWIAVGSLAAVALALPASMAGQAALAASGSSRALFTMTISGIDRDGTALPPLTRAAVFSVGGVNYLSGGHIAHIPAGTYDVAAPLWRAADGSTQTLVAKRVHVTGNVHVTLSAVNAVPVAASVDVPGVTQGGQTMSLCIRNGSTVNFVAGFLVDSPGTVYVKHMSSVGLLTDYQTYWQGPDTLYDVAGVFSGGIPAHPAYHAHVASMARVHVQLRAQENVTPLAAMLATYGQCGSTEVPVASLPAKYTDYRTPGPWTTNLNFGSLPSHVQKDQFKSATYHGGHTYSDLFGSAAYGPGQVFPVIDGHDITYSPGNLLSDPVIRTGFDCEGKAKVTLKRAATLIKSQQMTFCAKVNEFQAHPGVPGWYTMTATARRWNPMGALPAGLLSTKVSVSWRFRYAPVTGHLINAQAAPVTVTRFTPEGLGLSNNAVAGSTTTVRFVILRGGGEPVATPQFKLKKVLVQASFNDGLTWHALPATQVGSHWITHVSNPAAGYISLRTIVTDVHGDRTTETILRAYLAS